MWWTGIGQMDAMCLELRKNLKLIVNVREWIQKEVNIKRSRKYTRKDNSKRTPLYPLAEKKLHSEVKKMRSEGRAVKSWWLKGRAKEIITNMYPGANFRCSDHWLRLFLKRNRLSLRRKTHKAQRLPKDVI